MIRDLAGRIADKPPPVDSNRCLRSFFELMKDSELAMASGFFHSHDCLPNLAGMVDLFSRAPCRAAPGASSHSQEMANTFPSLGTCLVWFLRDAYWTVQPMSSILFCDRRPNVAPSLISGVPGAYPIHRAAGFPSR